jgi:hypothetical protein
LLPGLRIFSLLPAAIRSRLAWMLEYSPFFIRLALPAPHACLGSFCRAFSLGDYTCHPGAKRLLAASVSFGLWVRGGSLQVAASSSIVLGSTFCRQACAFRHRQLLAATNC